MCVWERKSEKNFRRENNVDDGSYNTVAAFFCCFLVNEVNRKKKTEQIK